MSQSKPSDIISIACNRSVIYPSVLCLLLGSFFIFSICCAGVKIDQAESYKVVKTYLVNEDKDQKPTALRSVSVGNAQPDVDKTRFKAVDINFTGQPELDSLRANSVASELTKVDVNQLTQSQLTLTFHSYLDNTNTICKRRLRMGNLGDGGWEICDDPKVRPTPACIIYSFGIHNDWSFDDDAARLYKCHVFSFDPSMKIGHFNRSELVHFYQWGIDGETGRRDSGWEMYTLGDIRKKLGHRSQVLDVLKMDTEMSEWPALANMLASGHLGDVRQLLIEFHQGKNEGITRDMIETLQGLEKIGFKKFLSHKNSFCQKRIREFPVIRSSCYEVHYMKDV